MTEKVGITRDGRLLDGVMVRRSRLGTARCCVQTGALLHNTLRPITITGKPWRCRGRQRVRVCDGAMVIAAGSTLRDC